ncbi:MAG: RNA methyltransferase [Candidatus Nephrothrix sp. EaCA]|nr:MAG: RNA methyltransferase [Candidatus Nephrothrix sp. EaCA]
MKKLKLHELGRLSADEFRVAEKNKAILILDNVRSLHNVGSAFRTADAFRLEKIYLAGITGVPPHREIHKTALGATDTVEWQYFEAVADAVRTAKNDGRKIIAVEQTDQSIPLGQHSFSSAEKYCFVFGNEVNGVSEEAIALADAAIEIPQEGAKHSLNVSVCIGIVMWEVFRNKMG